MLSINGQLYYEKAVIDESRAQSYREGPIDAEYHEGAAQNHVSPATVLGNGFEELCELFAKASQGELEVESDLKQLGQGLSTKLIDLRSVPKDQGSSTTMVSCLLRSLICSIGGAPERRAYWWPSSRS